MTCHTKDLYHYNTGLHRGWGHHCSGELGVRGVFFVLALLLSYEHFIFVSIIPTNEDYIPWMSLSIPEMFAASSLPPDTYDGDCVSGVMGASPGVSWRAVSCEQQ